MENIRLNNDELNKINNSGKRKKVVIWTIGAVLLTALAIALIFVFVKDDSTTPSSRIEVSNTSLSVQYSPYLGYSAVVKGTAKNVTSRNFSYASVEFSVYDASGNNLGTALANINNLGSGDTWQFEANLLSYPNTEPISFKLADITVW